MRMELRTLTHQMRSCLAAAPSGEWPELNERIAMHRRPSFFFRSVVTWPDDVTSSRLCSVFLTAGYQSVNQSIQPSARINHSDTAARQCPRVLRLSLIRARHSGAVVPFQSLPPPANNAGRPAPLFHQRSTQWRHRRLRCRGGAARCCSESLKRC